MHEPNLTRNQKPIIHIQKLKRKVFKHNTKESCQAMGEENKKRKE